MQDQNLTSPILIVGGLGFIGHRLATKLSRQHRVIVIDHADIDTQSSAELRRRHQTLVSHGVTVHNIDVFDQPRMSDLLHHTNFDTVFHLAGASSVKSTYSGEGFRSVLALTNELLQHLSNATVGRFVYFSSSMIYGDFCHTEIDEEHAKKPVDRYGALKYASEILVNSWASETETISVILRPTAVYGPHDVKLRLVAKLLNQAMTGQALTIHGDGQSRLDFTYVDDVVNLACNTLTYPVSGEFNVSFGHARSLNELVKLIQHYYPEIEVSYQYQNTHPTAQRGGLNSTKAIRLLDYQPRYTLEHGLAETLRAQSNLNLPVQTIPSESGKPIPLAKADVISSDFHRLRATLQTGWYTSGDANREFEQLFANYLRQTDWQALSVNSCASALTLALRAHNVTGGVIAPAFTFSATANAIELAGATPQFVDIEPVYLGLDPAAIELAITPTTQAILVVHLAGTVCDIEAIGAIADRHNLVLIEDCAQALGATLRDQPAGTFGDTACFSFFPTKMITTGEGGMLISKHPHIVDTARALANHGYGTSTLDREKQTKPWHRSQQMAGYNFRMSSINASLGVSQMERIDNIVGNRRSKALQIVSALADTPQLEFFNPTDRDSVFQALNVLIPSSWDRDQFVLDLRKQNLMASVHYPEVLPLTTVFKQRNTDTNSFPIATNIASRIVTLPLYGSMTELDIERLVTIVRNTANLYADAELSLSTESQIPKSSMHRSLAN